MEPESRPVGWRRTVRAFGFAINGLIEVFQTQPHMPLHFLAIVLTLLLAVAVRVPPVEFLLLLSAIAFVLTVEMVNTAVESAVDLVTNGEFDARARYAKDVAAGAVLVAVIYSVVVGCMVFFNQGRLADVLSGQFLHRRLGSVQLAATGLVLLCIAVIRLKDWAKRGTFLRGGVVSGHTALGFFAAAWILVAAENKLLGFLATLLALLLAQSRVEGGFHSIREAAAGAALGVAVAGIVFLLGAVILK